MSYLVENPKDRFSRDVAHIVTVSWVSLLTCITSHFLAVMGDVWINSILWRVLVSLMRSWYFSSSVNSFLKCACAATQWGKMSDFWSNPVWCVRTAKALARLMSWLKSAYSNDPKFSDRQVWANSIDPDQTAPDQGLHCLPFCLHLLDASLYTKATLFKF